MVAFIVNALKIIFVLGFLVLIHEGGHFCIAKLCKIKVNEFAIGFGPTLVSKTKGETKYALHLIPFGGFVSMEGEEEHSDKEGSFSNASTWKKVAIVMAGGIVNIVFGIIVYFLLITNSGNLSTNVVNHTLQGYAAESAGILQGDKILFIDKQKVRNSSDINQYLSKTKDKEVTVTIERNKNIIQVTLQPNKLNTGDTEYYYLGIVFQKIEQSSLSDRIYYGLLNTGNFIGSIFENLRELFTGKVNVNQMVGIVGISDMVVKTSGFYEYAYMIAVISISLGITNLLPFPPLDGGKVVLYLVEAIRRKPIKEEIELKLQAIGFAIIIALSIYVTYRDIIRII